MPGLVQTTLNLDTGGFHDVQEDPAPAPAPANRQVPTPSYLQGITGAGELNSQACVQTFPFQSPLRGFLQSS